jgi:hypothetical protein
VELDLTALLVQNREDAGLAVASKVVPRKLDGYSRLGELVGGQQIGSSSGSKKTPTDETKVAFACIRILQNQRVITSMMREYVASHAVDSDGLLEFSDVDEKMLILEGSFRASAVHEDAMAKLVVGDPKS